MATTIPRKGKIIVFLPAGVPRLFFGKPRISNG
jgi:hypothetical protein